MRTRVVNIHKEEYDVYIGRAGKGLSGYFGNPIRLDAEKDRQRVLEQYKVYLLKRIQEDSEFKERLMQLKGKRLGCFCSPKLCHGMVIVEYLEGISVEQQIAEIKAIRLDETPSCFDKDEYR